MSSKRPERGSKLDVDWYRELFPGRPRLVAKTL
jgi:hypothetical protein